jgi:hypothetical protein
MRSYNTNSPKVCVSIVLRVFLRAMYAPNTQFKLLIMKEEDEDSETQTKSRISFGPKPPPIIHVWYFQIHIKEN